WSASRLLLPAEPRQLRLQRIHHVAQRALVSVAHVPLDPGQPRIKCIETLGQARPCLRVARVALGTPRECLYYTNHSPEPLPPGGYERAASQRTASYECR